MIKRRKKPQNFQIGDEFCPLKPKFGSLGTFGIFFLVLKDLKTFQKRGSPILCKFSLIYGVVLILLYWKTLLFPRQSASHASENSPCTLSFWVSHVLAWAESMQGTRSSCPIYQSRRNFNTVLGFLFLMLSIWSKAILFMGTNYKDTAIWQSWFKRDQQSHHGKNLKETSFFSKAVHCNCEFTNQQFPFRFWM